MASCVKGGFGPVYAPKTSGGKAECGGCEARGRVIVAVAPNGGRKTKADHPALPLTADELARTAAECLERGASMIHLHVRDAEGGTASTPRPIARRSRASVRRSATGWCCRSPANRSAAIPPAEQRAAVLETNPEAVSLALRELAPEEADEKDFGVFLGKLKQMRVWPQIILYTPTRRSASGRC